MGQNKRFTRKRYDSMSVHALIIGALYKKIIGFRVLSEDCSACRFSEKTNKLVPKHDCPKNYVGSSKSMEVEAIFQLKIEAWEKKIME